VVKRPYIPSQGDFITMDFDPQSGHEQKGRRPALVISQTLFNQKTKLAIVCPITNTDRKHPLHVTLPDSLSLTGFIMVDQVKSIDFTSRHAKFLEKSPNTLIQEVLDILEPCIWG
jgi:mRNA interferase MazF